MTKSPEANPLFRAGRNMALKIPLHEFDATLAFYQDTLGLPVEVRAEGSHVVRFGNMRLWLDRAEGVSQAELWLETVTSDLAQATSRLEANGVVRCDAIEPLPEGFRGFWVMSPCNVVHLVCEPDRDGGAEEEES